MFPFSSQIEVENGFQVHYREVLSHVFPLLTEARQQKIKDVVAKRTFSCAVVLENIYDRGNASAVMRSAEALGFAQIHMIDSIRIKESQRTTAGADKWLEISKWKNTGECVRDLKRQGLQVVTTHLGPKSVDIREVDFSKPTAIVLGNEKDGASAEMVEGSDICTVIPMQGFVQSYNISVAAALCLYHIFLDRTQRLGQHGDLTSEQQEIMQAYYAIRTLDSSQDILKRLSKGESP